MIFHLMSPLPMQAKMVSTRCLAEKEAATQDKDDAAAKAAEAEEQAGRIPLNEYMQYLRDVAADEARAAAK